MAKVLEATGKMTEEFEQEGTKLKNETESAKMLQHLNSRTPKLGTMLLDWNI
jgi:hypothetical protein